jgi:hypothetical protein
VAARGPLALSARRPERSRPLGPGTRRPGAARGRRAPAPRRRRAAAHVTGSSGGGGAGSPGAAGRSGRGAPGRGRRGTAARVRVSAGGGGPAGAGWGRGPERSESLQLGQVCRCAAQRQVGAPFAGRHARPPGERGSVPAGAGSASACAACQVLDLGFWRQGAGGLPALLYPGME